MKRTLLFAIMCVFALFGNVNAQETVEWKGNQSFPSWCNPIADFYNYSVVQQIYTAAELWNMSSTTISSVSFKKTDATQQSRNLSIYLVNTTKGSFDG